MKPSENKGARTPKEQKSMPARRHQSRGGEVGTVIWCNGLDIPRTFLIKDGTDG
jgi:hypothetical protein